MKSAKMNKRLRVLFVTENMPTPPIAGSSQRTAILLRAISEVADTEIFLLRSNQAKDFLIKSNFKVAGNYDVHTRKNFWINLLRVVFPMRDYRSDKCVENKLRETFIKGDFDILIGRYVSPSLKAGLANIGPAVIDVDDIDISVLQNRIKSSQTSWFMAMILKYRLFIIEKKFRSLLKNYKALFLSSAKDKLILPHRNTHIVPNIPFNESKSSELSLSSGINVLWVGSFNHRVNLDGLDSFIKKQWPIIIEKFPYAVLRVVGSHLPEKYAKQWEGGRNISVAGFVENLDVEYKNAAFTIVPLWDGAGTKIKVLESLMFKRTAVVTSHAARGFDVLVEENAILVSDTDRHMVDQVVMLLENEKLRNSMEDKGYELVKENYSYSCVSAVVSDVLNDF